MSRNCDNSSCEVRVLTDAETVARAAAKLVAETAREAVADRGRFLLALSGGSTPRRLYELLATPEWATQVDWTRTEVFWSDERCVPPDHPDSNYGMAHEALLRHVSIPEAGVHRMRGELDPQVAADRYEQTLHDRLGPRGRLDLVLLGMGADGHTASLFPGTSALEEAERWCVANWVSGQGVWRLTLTYPAINAAHQVAFLVTGKEKAARLREVLAEAMDPTAHPAASSRVPTQSPAALVRPESGRLLWLVDDAAAAHVVVSPPDPIAKPE